MIAQVKISRAKKPKVVSWMGGRMTLSAQLGALLREEMQNMKENRNACKEFKALSSFLEKQEALSAIPSSNQLLIESFESREGHHLLVYPFEGRKPCGTPFPSAVNNYFYGYDSVKLGVEEQDVLKKFRLFGHVLNDTSRNIDLVNPNDTHYQTEDGDDVNIDSIVFDPILHPFHESFQIKTVKVFQVLFTGLRHKTIGDGYDQQRKEKNGYDIDRGNDSKFFQYFTVGQNKSSKNITTCDLLSLLSRLIMHLV